MNTLCIVRKADTEEDTVCDSIDRKHLEQANPQTGSGLVVARDWGRGVGGWMDGWVSEWMDRWMDGWMDECVSRCVDVLVDGWMDGLIGRWMNDGWMDA